MAILRERQTVVQNIRWLAVANIAAKPIWFFFLLLSTRFLGPEEFGKYMYAVSFVAVVAVFLEGGIDVHLVRELSSDPTKYPRFVAHSLLLKIVSGFVLCAVVIVASLLGSIPKGMSILLILGSVYSAANALMLHGRTVFRAFEVMQYEAVSIAVEKLTVVGLCGLALFLVNDATSFMSGYVLAYATTSALTLYLVFKKIGRPTAGVDLAYLWKDIVKSALPFALMNLFTVIYYRSGTILLGALIGKEEVVGYYNAGYRLVESYMLFPSIIVGPMYPVFVRMSASMEDLGGILLTGARVVLVVSTLVAVPLFLFSDGFTLLFFGEGFARAAKAVGIVALSMIPVGMNFVFGTLVAASGRQRRGNVFILVITMFNIGINWFLIPRFAAAGAAVATVLTEGLLAMANIWIVRDFIRWPDFSRLLMRLSLPVGLLLVWRFFGGSLGTFALNVSAAMLVMVFLFIVLRIVSVADLRKLVRV